MSKLKSACHLFLFRYGIIKRILTHPPFVILRFTPGISCFPDGVCEPLRLSATFRFHAMLSVLRSVSHDSRVWNCCRWKSGFVTGLHALIQFLYNRLDGIVERAIQSSAPRWQ